MRTVFWSSGPPNVEDGKFAAVWVVQHVLRAAPGFVGPPIDVAVLKKDGGNLRATFLDDDELQEHLGSRRGCRQALRHVEGGEGGREDIPEPTPQASSG